MPKKSAKNNELLKSIKTDTSPQIYSLVLELVNNNREDLAEIVLKVDYLLEYTSTCIKQKDFEEAKETIERAKLRIDKLNDERVNIEHLYYLYEGIKKKIKR